MLSPLQLIILSCVYVCNTIASVGKIKFVTSVAFVHHIPHNGDIVYEDVYCWCLNAAMYIISVWAFLECRTIKLD